MVDGTFMARMRAHDLKVYPWTFKNEPHETRRFMRDLRVDGVFTNNPDVALDAR
ncbi:MAG: hypothetical protein KDB69_05230 [Acidimicrobiia bacterium]|nr:hypothetical protein [Acidimicrobiia bacterium]